MVPRIAVEERGGVMDHIAMVVNQPDREDAFRAALTHGRRSADSIPVGNSASSGIKIGKPFLMGKVAWHPEQTSDTCSRASVASRSGSSGQRRLARKASSIRRLYGSYWTW